MKQIINESERVQQLFNCLPGDEDHRGNKYKSEREWWVLGSLKKIFDGEYIEFPEFAVKLEENDTDFAISFDDKNIFKKIQITEIPPIENMSKSNPLNKIDIWKVYEEIIYKKLIANFGKNNWLVIYFDIRYSQITSIGTWHNTILNMSRKLTLPKHNYEKIIVMNPKGTAAISIFPYFFIICPEWRSNTTIVEGIIISKKNYYKILKEYHTKLSIK